MFLEDDVAFMREFDPQRYLETLPPDVVAKSRLAAKRRSEYLRLHVQVQEITERAKRPIVVQSPQAARSAKRKYGDSAWPTYRQVLHLAHNRNDGPKVKYSIVKVLRGKMIQMREEGKYQGKDCENCGCFHASDKVCPLFTFPAHRPTRFKDLWTQARSAGVLGMSESTEWNTRMNRQDKYKCDESGACISDASLRHLREGLPGGPV